MTGSEPLELFSRTEWMVVVNTKHDWMANEPPTRILPKVVTAELDAIDYATDPDGWDIERDAISKRLLALWLRDHIREGSLDQATVIEHDGVDLVHLPPGAIYPDDAMPSLADESQP